MYNNNASTRTTKSMEDSILKAQLQQRQMVEKERRLIQLLDDQQERTMKRVNELSSVKTISTSVATGQKKTVTTGASSSSIVQQQQQGKVRQMFQERRKNGQGIDKGNPLEPLPKTTLKSASTINRNVSPKITTSTTSQFQSRQTRVSPLPPVYSPTSTSRTSPTTQTFSTKPSPTAPTPTKQPTRPSSLSKSPIMRSNRVSPISPKSPIGMKTTTPTSDMDENMNIPTSTKYMDAYDVNKREDALGVKLRNMKLENSGSVPRPASVTKKSIPMKTSPSPTTSKPSKPKPTTSASPRTSPTNNVPPPPGMAKCKICSRNFNEERISVHENICKKTKVKKRKPLDPTKMRMEGTDAEPYLRTVSAKSTGNNKKSTPTPPPKQNWRAKHEDFIRTIRAAKEYTKHVSAGGNPADLPPPPPSDTSDYIKCDYCGRKFSQSAGERHIPKCKNIKSNK